MLILDDETLVYSASDLVNAAACEFAVLSALDALLGRGAPRRLAADDMLERIAALGVRHEDRVLAEYVQRLGRGTLGEPGGVVGIARPTGGYTRDELERARDATLVALRGGADVVYQAGFFDGRFMGWADFVTREDDGAYAVVDTKLARHARVTALLQLAAYADQVERSGITVAPEVRLILGDHTVSRHRTADLGPVFRDRRARLEELLDEHRASGRPVEWGHTPARACGRCDVCAPMIEQTQDVLLVANLRASQRARLSAVGITTIDELSASTGKVDGIGAATLDRLRAQARLQVARRDAGPTAPVPFEIFDATALDELPPASPGDIFFDFEGDPLWTDDSGASDPHDWGLEYLFGVIEIGADGEPAFRAFWAHDRAQERQALLDFLAYVRERRATYPDLHIYHYAPYERTALLRLAGRHGVGEDAVDDLLREHVLVDLYATVRASVRTGQSSYSIKKLEPLYMPSARDGDVQDAAASIVEYAEACAVRDQGLDEAWQQRLDAIAEYNEYDCVSTLRLRNWLVAQGGRVSVAGANVIGVSGVTGTSGPVSDAVSSRSSIAVSDAVDDDGSRALVVELMAVATPGALAGSRVVAPRTAEQQGIALVAASIEYHRREAKPFWWEHFSRLETAPDEWTDTRNTFVVESARVISEWERPTARSRPHRTVQLGGVLEPGSDLRSGAEPYALYPAPGPLAVEAGPRDLFATGGSTAVVEVEPHEVDGRMLSLVTIDQILPKDVEEFDNLPVALTPGAGPRTKGIEDVLDAYARRVVVDSRALPPKVLADAAMDVLLRRPPRTRSGRPIPLLGASSAATTITSAVLDLDNSYVAVQGPPGTGKTYTGARVIAALVAQGWSVGVVAQSHAGVENLLRGLRDAGVADERIAKKAEDSRSSGQRSRDSAERDWVRPASPNAWLEFYAEHRDGCVVGGTTWDFVNSGRLPATRKLDLLVVEEAGQYALANTIAVAQAAQNLLLLGDPQQLPQVSQGTHPEPVDRSALGWLSDGHETMPPELGYFLAESWRMHPALCAAVSRLSYGDQLTSAPAAAQRHLAELTPGIGGVQVAHEGNSASSSEEADEVVRQVQAVLGLDWCESEESSARGLDQGDVLVVAPYNAQVWLVRDRLAAADLRDVEVGTVDKFQGREAPIVIVTMAASSADDVPRGMEFLLSRNRINVAVSRAQWRAVVIHSTRLTDYLPSRPAQLAELGAFIGLLHPYTSPVVSPSD